MTLRWQPKKTTEPIDYAPALWDRRYRRFWWDWLQDRRECALLQLGDWWQP